MSNTTECNEWKVRHMTQLLDEYVKQNKDNFEKFCNDKFNEQIGEGVQKHIMRNEPIPEVE